EPVHETRVHTHVVLVADAVKTQNHPVELNRTKHQTVLPKVQSAAEQHRHAAVADAGSRGMRATEQSVNIRREVALRSRDHRSDGVGVEAGSRFISRSEI